MGPFELIYYIGYKVKKLYDKGRQRRLTSTVISIGNITVGGTGKTPLVMATAREAFKKGLNPCILTRGYKGSLNLPSFVSKGFGALLTEKEAGDEPVLMAEKLSMVPIVKAKDRYEGGIFAIEELKPIAPFLFILDDGFQHFRLHRDKDILLINALNPFGNGKLLPIGTLREPLRQIKRADVLVITNSPDSHGKEMENLVLEIRKYNPYCPLFFGRHIPAYVKEASNREFPIDMLYGKNIYAFCAIGEPESFLNTLNFMGVNLKGFRQYRDHYRFKGRDIKAIQREAERCGSEWIITTEKDIIRLKDIGLPDNLVTLGIEFKIDNGFYDEVFKGLMPV
ncbi:MAG: tetraacyldisaccharide 4'-kinase [Nitrospirae bacterium]|nr:tetraacyldisaccharide 4'-kinase [Nitrospirota bacterium]